MPEQVLSEYRNSCRFSISIAIKPLQNKAIIHFILPAHTVNKSLQRPLRPGKQCIRCQAENAKPEREKIGWKTTENAFLHEKLLDKISAYSIFLLKFKIVVVIILFRC